MSHIETGSTKLSLQVFGELAEALHTSADSLLYDKRLSNSQTDLQEIADVIQKCTPAQAQVLKEIILSSWNAMNRYL